MQADTKLAPIFLSPIGRDKNVKKTGKKYGTEFEITYTENDTGVYIGNIIDTSDNKAVPNGVGRWMPNEGKNLYGLWKEGVFIRPLRDSGTPVIANYDKF
jgi:hypothetical protein